MIRDVHPGSRIQNLIFTHPQLGVKDKKVLLHLYINRSTVGSFAKEKKSLVPCL
jgi:hypothetical protein